MEAQRQKTIEAINDHNCGFYFEQSSDKYSLIEGSPVAYWISEKLFHAFEGDSFGDAFDCYVGMRTGDNDRFLRLWYEVSFPNSQLYNATSESTTSITWVPYLKGGDFRRWYYNYDYVVNWRSNGKDIKDNTRKVYPQLGENLSWKITNESQYFREGITFNAISSSAIGFKKYLPGAIFSNASHAIMNADEDNLYYGLALLNTNVVKNILELLSPTINYTPSDIRKIPLIISSNKSFVENIGRECEAISKEDWDSFETSWDFSKHPLLPNFSEAMHTPTRLDVCYQAWSKKCDARFTRLQANEEELNTVFIEAYGLQDELTPQVEDKDISVRKADLQRDIKSLISYAVGCMFGRYSLDAERLAYAGGKWDSSKYKSFFPDEDNCIPITDEEYFEDDIVGRFIEFIRVVYGDETLNENLEFIANALGNRGKTARDTIRQYFLKDFYKDHCQTYSVTGSGKRPIYWLFNSGKQNGFKALVYMHRWDADTVGNLRVEYLHKMQIVYEKEIENCQDVIDNSLNSREISAATRRKEKLIKQLKEIKEYDAKIAHIALSRIEIDLDDGVKFNYRKVQTGADDRFCEILADSKDIMIKEDSPIWQARKKA